MIAVEAVLGVDVDVVFAAGIEVVVAATASADVVEFAAVVAVTAIAAVDAEVLVGLDEVASYKDDELLRKDDSYRWRDAHFPGESRKSFCGIDHGGFRYVLADCTSA